MGAVPLDGGRIDDAEPVEEVAGLLDGFGGPERSVHVRPCPVEEVERVRAQYGLPRQYLLHVGELSRRKNIGALIRLFGAIAVEQPELHLVLAGKYGFGFEEEMAELSRLPGGTRQRIHQTGYVPRTDLPTVLRYKAPPEAD